MLEAYRPACNTLSSYVDRYFADAPLDTGWPGTESWFRLHLQIIRDQDETSLGHIRAAHILGMLLATATASSIIDEMLQRELTANLEEWYRARPGSPLEQTSETIVVGQMRISRQQGQAHYCGEPLDLTTRAIETLALLASNVGATVTYAELAQIACRNPCSTGKHGANYRVNVRTSIKRIRAAIKVVDPDFNSIENVPTKGYFLRDPLAPKNPQCIRKSYRVSPGRVQ